MFLILLKIHGVASDFVPINFLNKVKFCLLVNSKMVIVITIGFYYLLQSI